MVLLPLGLSFFDSHKDASPVTVGYSWEGLQQLLSNTGGRAEKYGPAWSPAYYPEGSTRGKANVTGVSCLVLDLDHLTSDEVVQVETNLAGRSYMAHPSFSSKPGDYCYRFVLELTRPVLAGEWASFWPLAIQELEVPADPSTSDASRLYFLPARPKGAVYRLDVCEGKPLDVDTILAIKPTATAVTQSSDMHGAILEGQREVTLHRLASSMRRSGWEADEILAAVSLRNTKHCHPPLPADEVLQTVASAQRYAVEDDQQELAEFIHILDERRIGPKASDDYVVDLMDFYHRHDADSDDSDKWLIAGVVGRGVPQIMAGPPKAHKSWVMYSQALAIASGRDWLGRLKTERGKVLIMSREDDEGEAHRRLFRLAVGAGVAPEDLRGWLSVNAISRFTFNQQPYVDAMRRTIDRWEPDLIQIDSLSRVHGGDENSTQDMSIVTQTWADLCKEYGVAIMILHHYNKGEGGNMLSRMRGTSDLGAVVRHAIGVQKLDIDDPAFKGGISAMEFDGNLPGMASAFSVGVRDGEVDCHKAVFLEYRSEAKKESFEQVKRDFVNFLLASEPEPQSKSAIYQSTKVAHTTVKAAVLQSLLDDQQVVLHGKKYRVSDPQLEVN